LLRSHKRVGLNLLKIIVLMV